VSDTFVAIEGATKRYGEILAVDNVSLSLSSSEVYSLVGANGAGKSTLLRMLVGITEPDAGRLSICGQDLSSRSPSTRRDLGYLPEELVLYERLTGKEYLELVAGLKDSDSARIPEELGFFELLPAQNKLVGGYSLGMRKKLGLAAAMMGSPKVLVLDEPLNGLDVEMMRKLRHRIEDERSNGKALLVASHVMSFVERISNRVGIMRRGKLVAEGPPAELRAQTEMNEAPFEDVFFHFAG
jgi:ABC-type multidrug transport system ATPase subunit